VFSRDELDLIWRDDAFVEPRTVRRPLCAQNSWLWSCHAGNRNRPGCRVSAP
jgi:hypothetical protein